MTTTLTPEQATAEANRLDGAERARIQVSQTTQHHPDMTIDDAYMVQAAWQRLRLERGEKLVGHKVGLTSRAMQSAMNITTPDSGFITDDMVFYSGASIPAGMFLDPRLEVELAFVLAEDLEGADLTASDVMDATEYVTPALELIAARSYRVDPETGRTRTVVDTISDNAANAGIITGGTQITPRQMDLRWVPGLLYRNDIIEESGVAAAVLDHPANGIAWLAKRYAEQGIKLEAGQIILSGSFTRPVNVAPGDNFRADYGPLGTFTVDFT